MRTRTMLPALLGFCLLAGCGGGGGNNSSILQTTNNRGNIGSAGAYAITDLGAETYYYGYYAYPNFGLYRSPGTITLNYSTQIVSGTTGRASIYQNGKLTNLGTSDYSTANAINGSGWVVGQAPDSKGNFHATLWHSGQQIDLGALQTPFEYSNSNALGISEIGEIVGESLANSASYTYHAFLWNNGKMTDLGTLGGDYSLAVGVNIAQQVVGWSSLPNPSDPYNAPVHAFLWQNGKMTDLGTLPGGSSSDVSAINENGQIVGSSSVAPQGLYSASNIHAVLWQGGAISDLGTLGGPGSIAFGINSNGQIVGSANTTVVDNDPPPYFWYYPGGGIGGGNSGNGGAPGGGVGGGNGSSNSNIPPGSSNANPSPIGGGALGRTVKRTRGIGDTYVTHAFLYQNGAMTDLNTQIDSSSGWELVQATDINDRGQIVGFGILNKRTHAFLLTPR
ncbi:MAG TPA: hypothetical protein VKU00_05340 [Chthonomonadaceae bacterium]|nr:hypothetical protein [Chthonomonadaceae bacterium]